MKWYVKYETKTCDQININITFSLKTFLSWVADEGHGTAVLLNYFFIIFESRFFLMQD